MKYQELYDHAIKNDATIVEFDTNVMPVKGWAVTTFLAPMTYGMDFWQGFFDTGINLAVHDHKDATHLIILHQGDGLAICWGRVYNNQQFAMGYAMGRGVDFIIDCFTNKKVIRR